MTDAVKTPPDGSSESGGKAATEAAPVVVELSFTRKAVIGVLVLLAAVLLVLFVYRIMPVLMLVFASALMGVLLSAATRLLSQYLRIPRAYALPVALVGVLVLFACVAYFIATTIRGQVVELNASVPAAIDSLKGQLDQSDWGKWTRERINTLPANAAEVFTPDLFWQQGVGLAGSTLGALGSILVVIVVGVYVALSPETYLKGVAALFPIRSRARVRQILARIGVTLEWWFFGQALAMLEVFVLTAIGLWVLGMKCTLALALLAGLFNIIPNFGPILAAVPAVLLAVAPHEGHPTFDFRRAVSVVILYLIVQAIDAYVVSPWIQKRAIALPAALIMLSQIIAFALLGPMGLLLATPILAAITVLVKMAYVEDVLGDRPALAGETGEVIMADVAGDFAPEKVHARGLAAAGRILRFDTESYPPEWVSAARRTFKQLLGAMPAPCEPNVRVIGETNGKTRAGNGYREIEFVFTSEVGADVPCWLLLPEVEKPAVMICLQGHSSGVHLSLGRAKSAADEKEIAEDADYAIGAVDQGFAALAYEQRLFGIRGDRRHADRPGGCNHASMTALLLGRTMAGERVLDVIRAIDALAKVPGAAVDLGRIGIMGHSTGGLISYYAAAIEPRISAVLASCCLCTYAASIAAVDHCADNYLPGVMQYFEMADMAGLIAPRALVMVSGREDPLFPHEGVETFAREANEIYAWLGAAEKFAWVAAAGGHRFFGKEAWRAFRAAAGW